MPRKIHSDIVKIIDERLSGNSLAQDCIQNGRPRQLFVEAVKACVGIRETSQNRGPEVELFQTTIGLSEESKWCMAFLQTCLAYAEEKIGIASPVVASGNCVNVWLKTSLDQRVKSIPLAGAIAIWQLVSNPRYGHTGMILDCDGTSFHAIEGNTNEGADNLHNAVSQSGDGVRFTHRYYDLFNPHNGGMMLLGCLKPF